VTEAPDTRQPQALSDTKRKVPGPLSASGILVSDANAKAKGRGFAKDSRRVREIASDKQHYVNYWYSLETRVLARKHEANTKILPVRLT
jgi:hypothetical protein